MGPRAYLALNVSTACKQLILAEFDHALEGTLDADWRAVLNESKKLPP